MRAVRAVVHNAKLLKLQCPSIDYPGEMKKEEQNVFVATTNNDPSCTRSFAKFYISSPEKVSSRVFSLLKVPISDFSIKNL